MEEKAVEKALTKVMVQRVIIGFITEFYRKNCNGNCNHPENISWIYFFVVAFSDPCKLSIIHKHTNGIIRNLKSILDLY